MNVVRMRQQLRRHPLLEDLLIASAFAALAIVTALTLVVPEAGPAAPPTGIIIVWALAFMAPLVVRRRWPLTVMVVMTAHFFGYWAVGKPQETASWLGLGAAIYSAAAYGRRPLARWVYGACLGGEALFLGVRLLAEGSLTLAQVLAIVLFGWLPFLLAWPMGSMMRTLRRYRVALEERNAELTVEREVNARRAVLEERVRIARELHDVVAHHVSLMTVQASAARRLFDRRPDEAMQAIGAVEEAGRAAIGDLAQLLGVLRRREEGEDLAPQPSLRQLPALVAHMEQAGLPVVLTIEGERAELPAGVELSAYRIVQEALTNTLKHAAATHADVTVRYADGCVELEVLDDGRATPGQQLRDGGKGLLGMRERVGLYGGRLDAGPRPGGGFRVHAQLRGNGS